MPARVLLERIRSSSWYAVAGPEAGRHDGNEDHARSTVVRAVIRPTPWALREARSAVVAARSTAIAVGDHHPVVDSPPRAASRSPSRTLQHRGDGALERFKPQPTPPTAAVDEHLIGGHRSVHAAGHLLRVRCGTQDDVAGIARFSAALHAPRPGARLLDQRDGRGGGRETVHPRHAQPAAMLARPARFGPGRRTR